MTPRKTSGRTRRSTRVGAQRRRRVAAVRRAFSGHALPLDADGVDRAAALLGTGVAELWAVIGVETTGCGFLPDRRPKILYERHVFSRYTRRRFDARHPDLSGRQPGGYGAGGAAQYERLARAMALDPRAALLATSWGMGQVMGFNAETVGYASAEDMVREMCASESAQVEAMARFIEASGLAGALRNHDWARFAAGYNGPNYRINNYDTRLAAELQYLERGGLPDLTVRAAQMHLIYLGYDPRGVDGIMGRFTRSAMNDFQRERNLHVTEHVDEHTVAALREAVARLAAG